jgi:hypothetical protein
MKGRYSHNAQHGNAREEQACERHLLDVACSLRPTHYLFTGPPPASLETP